jgi:glycolate oxidase
MVAEALKTLYPVQSLEDVVVPMGQIPAFMVELERLSARYGVLIPCYGHAADGNLHATPVKMPAMPMEAWRETLPLLLKDLYTTVADLGGTISGEHGIGSKRADYLPLVMDPTVIELQRRIKQTFDPLNILNPGKIVPQRERIPFRRDADDDLEQRPVA